MRHVRARQAITAGILALLTACSAGPDRANPSDSRPRATDPDIRLVSALVAPSNCDDLLGWLRTEARTRVGPYGFGGGVMYAEDSMGRDVAVPAPATTAAGAAERSAGGFAEQDAAASADGVAADESSAKTVGTNNQEAGVDEIDRVKTDGTRVLMTDGQRLLAIDITGDTPRTLGQVDLDMSGARLFLHGDRVLAVGAANSDEAAGTKRLPYTYVEQTALVEVDLSGGAPAIAQRATVDGHLVDARSLDGTARLVVASTTPANLPFVTPTDYDEAGQREALEKNRAVVEGSTLEQWLPRWTAPGATEPTALLDCNRTYHPREWAGAGALSVLTVGDDLADLQPTAVMTTGENVYASTTGLYVTTQRSTDVTYDERGNPQYVDSSNLDERTAVHRFDIGTSGPALYQGSGAVPGHVINQYAMSERDGDLRIATTVSWGRGVTPMPMPIDDCPTCGGGAVSSEPASTPAAAPDESVSSESSGAAAPAETPTSTVPADQGVRSMLTVLRLRGQELEQIGQLDGLGPNEQIQSVRFVEDRAYVVTFRQMDPLFVIDLSDPTAPKVLGELKEPGFSSYLHPVGEHRLLGVGSSGTTAGVITGAKVTLYDASDPLRPRAVAEVPVAGGYSTAGGDSHAFNWDPERRLAFVPLTLSDEQGMRTTGIAVYRVEGDSLTWVGFLDHRSHHGASPGPVAIDCGGPAVDCVAPGWYGPPTVDRVVIVGDRIYAASTAGISQHEVATLAETAWVGWA